MNFIKGQSKGAFEMGCELDLLATDIDLLPTIIQDLIDALDLDSMNHTKDECLHIGLESERIYNTLMLIQRTLYRYQDDRKALWEEYKKLQPKETA